MSPSLPIRFLFLAAFLLLGLTACATPQQPPMPVGDLKLGQAHFTHPTATGELLAGYQAEDAAPIEEKILGDLDLLFSSLLVSESAHTFTGPEKSLLCEKTVKAQTQGRQAALRHWAAVGRCMGVDLLVVPQILEWHEREGPEYAAVAPAAVIMDIYVIDVQGDSLISRSHYDAMQSALTSNLLELGSFIKRGGKWVQARDLAREGMAKAVKELGL
ncbi:MAG: hypothetical protein LBP61_03540 [Desulfovibrio sp.]|jgi:hypothetical protein|nr:hypothetical protein [Desulfovibrio sp.]